MGCGPPPPIPASALWLVYPIPNATAVPQNIGDIVFADLNGLGSADYVTVKSASGAVPIGEVTAAPSPLPSPRVTPGAEFGGNVTYVEVSVPTLASETTYTVKYSYTDWADNPPTCSTRLNRVLGSFTTQ